MPFGGWHPCIIQSVDVRPTDNSGPLVHLCNAFEEEEASQAFCTKPQRIRQRILTPSWHEAGVPSRPCSQPRPLVFFPFPKSHCKLLGAETRPWYIHSHGRHREGCEHLPAGGCRKAETAHRGPSPLVWKRRSIKIKLQLLCFRSDTTQTRSGPNEHPLPRPALPVQPCTMFQHTHTRGHAYYGKNVSTPDLPIRCFKGTFVENRSCCLPASSGGPNVPFWRRGRKS